MKGLLIAAGLVIALVLTVFIAVLLDSCEWDAHMKRAAARQPTCVWER